MKYELTDRHAIGSPSKMHLAQKIEEILQTHKIKILQHTKSKIPSNRWACFLGKLTDSVFEWSSSAALTEVTFGNVTTVAVSFFPPSFDILPSNLRQEVDKFKNW